MKRIIVALLLAALSGVATANCAVSPSTARELGQSASQLARFYFAYGYARGQEDVLSGATTMGDPRKYKLPPITDALESEWWRAAKGARNARDVHAQHLRELMQACARQAPEKGATP
ncbi:hypothetical protein [Ottowia sp. VDI28]|uniref:hypothetical protein n=1 Tax=Ottowia sp. VDI28 TaxID=3133968 RepID=UPI003C2D9495